MARAGGAARIGVFGGTFDPVHFGHIAAAANARHQLRLDRVLLVVAHEPWQKQGRRLAPAPDRLAMVAAAVAGIEGLEASAMEIERGGESYSADTLEALATTPTTATGARDELFLIVGSDVVSELHTWRKPEVIRRLATVAVVTRKAPGAAAPSGVAEPLPLGPEWRTATVTIPTLDISSTDLRARAAEGRPLDGLVPREAIRFMVERRLYAGG
ncbi:MAG: nicotinate-nucleotide adenylyltransferase [Acidimicrobiales bacterium]